MVENFNVTGDGGGTSQLLIPSVEWTRTFPPELDKRISPDFGTLLQLNLRGGSADVLSDTNFIQPMVSGKFIYAFANKTRFLTRGAIGGTFVDNFDALPTSLRFFTGGDTTVRGFSFNNISPRVDGDVVGGRFLVEASVEYQVPIAEKWNVAAFFDVGDAYDDRPDLQRGVGLGLHWLSPIGPVRIDVGHALDRPPGSRFRLHLTIGSDL